MPPVRSASRFAIALAAGVLLLAALGVAVALTYHPVRPRILCGMPLGTGEMAVYFGYSNEADAPVEEPLGSANVVVPAGRPPTRFSPGSSGRYPNAAFVVTAKKGDEIAWTLGPRTVRFDDETMRCPIPRTQSEPDRVAWVPPKPAVIEVPPPEPPKPEPEPPKPPEPPPDEVKPPPKLGDRAPRPKQPKPEAPKPVEVKEPVALALTGLTNLEGGIAIQKGDFDSLGDASVEARPETTKPREIGVVGGVVGGVDTGEPAAPPKRTAARVKVRPRGEWPADAPPRAGAVLVRLSLLVGEDGKVKQVKVVKSAGAAFDREARAVGLRAVFEPATVDGKPLESWVPWDVEFTPDDL